MMNYFCVYTFYSLLISSFLDHVSQIGKNPPTSTYPNILAYIFIKMEWPALFRGSVHCSDRWSFLKLSLLFTNVSCEFCGPVFASRIILLYSLLFRICNLLWVFPELKDDLWNILSQSRILNTPEVYGIFLSITLDV